MAEKKYTCIVKTYYLSRLWYPERPGIEASTLFTDRDDVPLEYFRPEASIKKGDKKVAVAIKPSKTPAKKASGNGTKMRPPIKLSNGDDPVTEE